MSTNGQRYDVGGVLLKRPFKIRRLGHFGFNVTKVEECREFYGDLLGFTVSDKADFSRAPWFPKGQDLGPQSRRVRWVHGGDGSPPAGRPHRPRHQIDVFVPECRLHLATQALLPQPNPRQ